MSKKENEVFIRSDGWMYSKEGLDKLKEGGYKGHDIQEQKIAERLGGKRCRVYRPLTSDAIEIIRREKNFVERAAKLSAAIVRANKYRKSLELAESTEPKMKFAKLLLTEEAFAIVEKMTNKEYLAFVSAAVRKYMG